MTNDHSNEQQPVEKPEGVSDAEWDALAASFDEMTIAKRPDCPTCSIETGKAA